MIRFRLFIICFLALPASAAAVQNVAYGRSPADDFDRRQAEKRELKRLQDLRAATPDETSPPPQDLGIPAGGVCFPIDHINIDGAHKLSPPAIARLTALYSGKCLGIAEIHALVKALTNAYINKGYIAARIYIPEQDIKQSRVLRLKAEEGRLSDIYYNDEPAPYNGKIAFAFPGLKGGSLNMRDIEQGLDQMNKPASANARSAVLPGQRPGETIINITNKPAKPWQVSLSHDNMGQTQTGYARYNANFSFDNILRLNDVWNFAYQRSDRDYWNAGARPREGNSNSYSGGVNLPYGYWSFNFSGYTYDYRSNVPGNFGKLHTSGSSNELRGGFSRLLYRDGLSLTVANFSLAHKKTDNYILGSKIETGSRAYTVADLSLSHSRRWLAGTWSFDLHYLQGLSWFGAVKAHEAGAGDANPRFGKWSAAISAVTPFQLGRQNFILNNLLTGQYARDNLFGAEQISLGDFYNVRGARDNLLFGNAGFFTRNDVSWRTAPWRENAPAAALLGEFRPYAGLDFGRVFAREKYGLTNGHLASWTAGARLTGGKLSLDAGYSRLFSLSGAVAKMPAGLAFVSAAVSF